MSLPPPRTLRTKRNFKSLQLPTGPTLNLPPTTNPSGFRKPPPPNPISAAPSASVLNPNVPPPNSGSGNDSGTPVTPQQRSAIRATITQTIAGFPRKSLDLQNEKLVHIREIGQGNGGSVSLVRHRDTDIIMAKKIVLIDAKPAIRKQIVRELQIMHECNSTYIIECYGSYLADPNICICMEYMDRGSFDRIYKKIGPIQIEVVARVAMSVLEGLTYLYDVHRIIHRDIKPSNILCNTKGEIKLCDFGVSGELINSIANTFVGTSIYMSPERIQGAEYSVKSDVWSLGITLVELATGRFPFSGEEGDFDASSPGVGSGPGGGGGGPGPGPGYGVGGYTAYAAGGRLPDLDEDSEVMMITAATTNLNLNPFSPFATATIKTTRRENNNGNNASLTLSPSLSPPNAGAGGTTHKRHTRRKSNGVSLHGGGMTMSIIELMHHIVREPAPRLPEGRFLKSVDEFVGACLEKEVEKRKTPAVLLRYKWMQDVKVEMFDLATWAAGVE